MDDGDEFSRVDRVAGREDAAWEETELQELCDRFILGRSAGRTLRLRAFHMDFVKLHCTSLIC